MLKKHLSPLFAVALMIVPFAACDDSGSPLTELWRIAVGAREHVTDNYIFDSKNNMILWKQTFTDAGDFFSISKINGSGRASWSVDYFLQIGRILVKTDNNDNVFAFYTVQETVAPYRIRSCVDKYSPDGVLLWQNPDLETAYSIFFKDGPVDPDGKPIRAIDRTGNIFVAGTSGSDRSIVKLDPNGALLWQQNVTINTSFSRLIIDSSGNAYFGCAVNGSREDDYALRIIKFNGASGSILWDKTCFPGLSQVGAFNFSMIFDPSENLIVARGDGSATINKFDPAGNQLWEYAFKPTDTGTARDVQAIIKCDSGGNVIISAVVSVLTGLFPTGSFPFPFGYDYCQLIKIDSTGKKLWSKKVSTIMVYNGDMGGQLNVDKNDGIYVFCTDNLLVKYNAGGKKLWSYEPEITNVAAGYLSEWHVDTGLNLWWVVQGDGVQMTEPFRITKFSQE